MTNRELACAFGNTMACTEFSYVLGALALLFMVLVVAGFAVTRRRL